MRLTASDGGQLSITDPDLPRADAWSPGMKERWVFNQPQVTLRAGEKRLISMNLANIAPEISKEKMAAGLPDLPWGATVNVKFALSLLAPSGGFDNDQMGVHKQFEILSYSLPERRPD